MKKILSLLLVMALVLGTMTVALAVPADVVGTEYEDVATKLGALGLMIGDEGGFRAGDSITRAEFSTIVVRALGLESAAKFSTSATKFTDVTEAHQWAWGYINVATEQGVIIGYGDAKFGPADLVTYEQAITMLVRALGYEPSITGGYPAGYLAKAAELGITDDVTVAAGVGAPRGAVAQMLDNSLEVDMMERTTFGDEKKYEAVDKNLLENKMGVKIIEGQVTDITEEEITIDDATEEAEHVLAAGVSAAGLLNSKVKAWKLDKKIVYIDVDSTVYYDVIDEINGDDADVAFEDLKDITLSVSGKTLKMAKDYEGSFNNTNLADATELKTGYFVKLIVNDGKIVNVEAYNLSRVKSGLIEEVDEDYIVYTVGDTDGRKYRVDGADDMLVVINNDVASYDDLEEDMVFSAWDANDSFVIVATDAKVEGEVERYRDGDNIRIDGTYYDFAGDVYLSTDEGDEYKDYTDSLMDDFLEEEVVAYKDIAGNIVYIKGAVDEITSDFSVLVTRDWWASGDDYVRVFNKEGNTVTYMLDEDIEYVSGNADSVFAQYNIVKISVDADGYITNAEQLLVYDRYDSATETHIYTGGDTFSFAASDEFTSTTIKDGAKTYYVTDDTMFFDVSDPSDPDVVAWSELKNTSNITSIKGNIAYSDKNAAKAVAFTAGVEGIGGDDVSVGYVINKESINKDEFEAKINLGSEEVTVIFDKANITAARKELIFYTLKSDGTGKEIASKAINTTAASNLDGDVNTIDNYFYVASLYDVDGSYLQFDSGDDWVKVASDALVYEKDGTTYNEASVKDVEADDTVYVYVVDGIVQVLFFTIQ